MAVLCVAGAAGVTTSKEGVEGVMLDPSSSPPRLHLYLQKQPHLSKPKFERQPLCLAQQIHLSQALGQTINWPRNHVHGPLL